MYSEFQIVSSTGSKLWKVSWNKIPDLKLMTFLENLTDGDLSEKQEFPTEIFGKSKAELLSHVKQS
jgi:hypothetical protein